MGKRAKKNPASAPSAAGRDRPPMPDAFPSTRLSVLRAAADGDWDRFYGEYLLACTRETAIVCRTRGIPVQDVDDLIQSLAIRLQQNGGFAKQWRDKLRDLKANPSFRGNVAAKYLHARQHVIVTAKFRTYLKAVIKRLVLEHLRRRKVLPRDLGEIETAVVGIVEESIDSSLDRNLVLACLEKTAIALAEESRAASTKGKRRLFAALYYTTVTRFSQEALAAQFDVDRTTVTGLIRSARQRFVRLLEDATGIDDREYLRRTLAKDPEALSRALKDAKRNTERRRESEER